MSHEEPKDQQSEMFGRIEGFKFDEKYNQFPQVVHYKGQVYDARDSSGGNCIYRMTAEHRMTLNEPDYIEVDRYGNVLREWNG